MAKNTYITLTIDICSPQATQHGCSVGLLRNVTLAHDFQQQKTQLPLPQINSIIAVTSLTI
jgi:hypothetical protein